MTRAKRSSARGTPAPAARRRDIVAAIRGDLPELNTPALYRLTAILEGMLAASTLSLADYRRLERAARSPE
ncbi:MAG: hypothetical protein M3Z13_00810 [Candidatus Dormibacteraeota bacterium]|nr:hypothetical protein [Candidatus Dormibacteraeota bacterium]